MKKKSRQSLRPSAWSPKPIKKATSSVALLQFFQARRSGRMAEFVVVQIFLGAQYSTKLIFGFKFF